MTTGDHGRAYGCEYKLETLVCIRTWRRLDRRCITFTLGNWTPSVTEMRKICRHFRLIFWGGIVVGMVTCCVIISMFIHNLNETAPQQKVDITKETPPRHPHGN